MYMYLFTIIYLHHNNKISSNLMYLNFLILKGKNLLIVYELYHNLTFIKKRKNITLRGGF